MATFMDFSVLNFFLPVFTFLFVLVVCYALLQKTKILGGQSKLDFLASFAIAMLTLFTGNAVKLINYMTPWFVIFIVFTLLLFLMLMSFGWKEKEIWLGVGGKNGAIVIAFLILIMAMTYVFGDVFNPTTNGTSDGGDTYSATSEINKAIFHPRVLSAIFILLFASFTILNLKEGIKQEG